MKLFDSIVITTIILFTVLSYIASLISALFPYLIVWLPIGLCLAIISLIWLVRYKFKNRAVLSIAMFTNGVMIALGQYLETIVPAISLLVSLLGGLLSLLMMVVWYYFKEGKRHVEVRIKREVEMVEYSEQQSIRDRLRELRMIKKRAKELSLEGCEKILAYQIAWVEFAEEKALKEEKNSLDFVLGREVYLSRNEYDQSPDR